MQIIGLTDDPKDRDPQTNFVYGLCNPMAPNLVRYVGRTNKPEMRLRFHRSFAGGGGAKEAWVYELMRNGLQPAMLIIECGMGDAWAKERESHYIRQYEQILNREKFALEVPQVIRFVWMQLYSIVISIELAKQTDADAKARAAKDASVIYSDPKEDWSLHDSTAHQAERAIEALAKEYCPLNSVVEWARIDLFDAGHSQ